MSSELIAATTTGLTVYAHILNSQAKLWNGTTFESYTGSNYSSYTVTMTEQGTSGVFVGNFPSTITTSDNYQLIYYRQSGGSPATGDTIISAGYITWIGTATTIPATASGYGLSFLKMQTFVFQQTGLDATDATNLSNVKQWINTIQQDIAGRWSWSFLKGREMIQTVVDKTDGTVSITSGSTTVTGTSTAFASGDVGKYIKFQGANDWYKVTAYTSPTQITIESPYAPTANLTNGTYTLRKLYYSLSTSADRIIDIRNWNTPLKFFEVDARTLDAMDPNPSSTNNTYAFVAYGYDTNGALQISPYPFPSDVRNLEVRTLRYLVDMVNDSDTTLIPPKWHHVLPYGACFLAFSFLKDLSGAKFWNSEYEKKIQDMLNHSKTSVDESYVLKPIDSQVRTRFLQLPGNYPLTSG